MTTTSYSTVSMLGPYGRSPRIGAPLARSTTIPREGSTPPTSVGHYGASAGAPAGTGTSTTSRRGRPQELTPEETHVVHRVPHPVVRHHRRGARPARRRLHRHPPPARGLDEGGHRLVGVLRRAAAGLRPLRLERPRRRPRAGVLHRLPRREDVERRQPVRLHAAARRLRGDRKSVV